MVHPIKKALFSYLKNQRGSVLVLVAGGMVAFLGLLALVTDVGLLALSKHKLQNTVDSAALAAAGELPARPDVARSFATQYALFNEVSPVTTQISADNTRITVTANRQEDYTFARAMGILSGSASASATARVASLTSIDHGVVPLAVAEPPPGQHFLYYPEPTLLKAGSGSLPWGDLGPGNYGALSLGRTGAQRFEENLRNGYNGPISAGTEVPTETGNMVGPTRQSVRDRIDTCTHSSLQACIDADCKRIILLPLYQPTANSGQVTSITVSGFAAFWVGDIESHGYLSGYFIRNVTISGDSDPNAGTYGLLGIKLVE